jgi:hypothetical protein
MSVSLFIPLVHRTLPALPDAIAYALLFLFIPFILFIPLIHRALPDAIAYALSGLRFHSHIILRFHRALPALPDAIARRPFRASDCG